MNQEVNYLASWEEYCEANGLDYEENAYLGIGKTHELLHRYIEHVFHG